jgi:hypothetical protein
MSAAGTAARIPLIILRRIVPPYESTNARRSPMFARMGRHRKIEFAGRPRSRRLLKRRNPMPQRQP